MWSCWYEASTRFFYDANPAPLENRRGRHSQSILPCIVRYLEWRDTSIKNGSPVQLIQRMNPESGLTKTIQATSRKRLKCSWRPLPNPDAVLSGTLVKSTLRGQIRSCLWYCGKGEHTESRKAYHVEVRRWDAWRKYVGVLLQSQMVGTRIPVTDIRSNMFLRRLSTVYQ